MAAMMVLLRVLWLALACGSVHTTLSKSDAKKAASKTLLEKVRVETGQKPGPLRLLPLGPHAHTAWETEAGGLGPALWLDGLSFQHWNQRVCCPRPILEDLACFQQRHSSCL